MGKRSMNMLDWMKGSEVLNLVVMDRHMEKDGEGKDMYVCDVCGADFSSSSDLADHMKTHEAETQEMMSETASSDYTPEETQAWENPVQTAVENYGYQQSDEDNIKQQELQASYDESIAPKIDLAEINQDYSNPSSEESAVFNSSIDNTTRGLADIANAGFDENSSGEPVTDIVKMIADEENPVSNQYQDVAPTSEPILPVANDESNIVSSPNPVYDAMGDPVFSGTKVYWGGRIYTVTGIDPDGDVHLMGTDENGITFETRAQSFELNTEESKSSADDQTEEEKAFLDKEKEIASPDTIFNVEYFQATTNDGLFLSDPQITGSAVDGTKFVVRWKVTMKKGFVRFEYPGGSNEREVNGVDEYNSSLQIMGSSPLIYSLVISDPNRKEMGRSELTVQSTEQTNKNRPPNGICINSFSVNGGDQNTPNTFIAEGDSYQILGSINLYEDVVYTLDCNGTSTNVTSSDIRLGYTAGRGGATAEIWTLRAQNKVDGSLIVEEKREVAVQKNLSTYSVMLEVTPDQAGESDPYTVEWSVIDDDPSKPIVNTLLVELRENGICIDRSKSNVIRKNMDVGTDNKIYTLMINEGNGWIEKAKKEITRVIVVGNGTFVTSLTASPAVANTGDLITVTWSVTGSANSNPEVQLYAIPAGEQPILLSSSLNGSFADRMGDHRKRVYRLYVRESGSNRSWSLNNLKEEVEVNNPNSSNNNNNVYIDRFDAPPDAMDGTSYQVVWAVTNPDITSVKLFINGVMRYTDRSRTIDPIMGVNDREYMLAVYDSNHVLKDSSLKKVRSLPRSNTGPSNPADNNPHGWIIYFDVGNLSKSRGETFTVTWSVMDSPSRNRNVKLLVNGQNQPGSFPLTGSHDLVMRDQTLNIRLEVWDSNPSRDVAHLTRVVTLNSARTVKERLLAGESEETLRSSTPPISDYAINVAKAEIEAERRRSTTTQHSAGVIKAEMDREEMQKKYAGGFWGDILKLQMGNVSKENVAHNQYAKGMIEKARQDARANIDKNTATIITSDNSLKALLAKEDTARMKIEMDAAKAAGKGGPIVASATRSPLAPGGLDSFVGSLVDEGKRQQESGVVLRNPLSMDMGGIVPRLPEREEDSMLDRTANNSFAAFGMSSLGAIVPKGGPQNGQTVAGLSFGGTTIAPSIVNPASLNATMNKSQFANPNSSVISQTQPSFSSASQVSLQNLNEDPLKGKSMEELKSLGLTKKYVDRTKGWRMPSDKNAKIFTSETGAQYYYDRGDRGVGRPANVNTFAAKAGTIDSIIKKGVGQNSTTPSASTPVNDFAFGQEDVYGKMEKDNMMLNSEYGKALPEFDVEEDKKFSTGSNIIDPTKVRNSGSINVADMLSGML